MLTQSTRIRCAVWMAVCLGIFVVAPGPAEAQQTSASGGFTIKATFDTWWLDDTDPTRDYKFSANGVISDRGWFESTGYYEDENGVGWYLYTFHGKQGDFHLDHVPTWALEGTEYPVELLPGTGAYAEVYGVAILTAQIRYRSIWYDIPGGGRQRYTYPVVTWTIDGVLIP